MTYNTVVVLIGASLLGVACALVGTFAVLRGRALLADAVAHATGLPVLTTPSSAIRLLQRRLIGDQK